MGANPDTLWVTFDTAQSRQMLEGRRVTHLPYIGPRDLKGTVSAMPVHPAPLKAERSTSRSAQARRSPPPPCRSRR